jgi:hypothetical protein
LTPPEEYVTSLTIAGVPYSDYSYNPATGVLTVQVTQPLTLGDTLTYTGVTASPAYRTDLLQERLPGLLTAWNAHGTVTLQRQFEGQPSASIEFTTLRSNEAGIRSAFFSGQRFNLWGMLFVCDSDLTITRLRNYTDPGDVIQVSVTLGGAWEPKSNEPEVRLLDVGRVVIAGTENFEGERALKTGSTTLAKLLRKLDIPYVGQGFTIDIPADTPLTTGVDPISLLTERTRSAQGFAFWSNPLGAEIRQWNGTSAHGLSMADVLSEIQVNYGLCPYYRNTELQLDREEGDAAEEAKINERWTIVTGDENPDKVPRVGATRYNTGTPISIRSPSMAFDAGGPVKERVTTTYVNSTVVEEKRETYGFMFTSLDVWQHFSSVSYPPPGGGTPTINSWGEWKYMGDVFSPVFWSPEPYWQLVGESTLVNTYDEEGYLTATETTGWKYSRFQQEGDGKELLEILREYTENYNPTNDQNTNAGEVTLRILNRMMAYSWRRTDTTVFLYPSSLSAGSSLTYEIFPAPTLRSDLLRLPQNDSTTYELADMTRFYPDVTTEEGGVVPRFAWKIERSRNEFIQAPNPDSTDDEPLPPLTTGEVYSETEMVGVIFPFEGMSQSEWEPRKNEERFMVESKRSNAEGAGLDNTLAIGTKIINAGRPSVHERLELYGEGRDEEGNLEGDTRTEPPAADLASAQPEVRLLINSGEATAVGFGYRAPNDDLTLPESGSVSYKGAGTKETALSAATVDAAIQATAAVEALTLTVAPTRRYQEGDRVVFEGVSYRVWSVTEPRRIQAGQLRTDGWQLDLRREFNPPVVLSEVDSVAKEDGG